MRSQLLEDFITDITPREFELLIKRYLNNVGSPLKNFSAIHDTKLSSADGTYQIDIYATFEALGCDIKFLWNANIINHQ